MADLAALYPAVRSLGIVPVGLTRHRAGLAALRPPDPDFCRAVIRQVGPRAAAWRRRFGVRFAYLADEFYLQAGRRVPPAEAYDDFPQLENGIGMVRDFLDEAAALLREPPPRVRVRRAALATGTLFVPQLAGVLRRLNCRWGVAFRALPVANRFFGPRVTVAGLLAGADIAAAADGLAADEWLAVPGQTISAANGRFLDDWAPADLAAAVGRPLACLDRGPAGLRALAEGAAQTAPPARRGGMKNL
jgi:NifB/MoaA-like Fe-S oxidoreductase